MPIGQPGCVGLDARTRTTLGCVINADTGGIVHRRLPVTTIQIVIWVASKVKCDAVR